MTKVYKFSELSNASRLQAALDYKKGLEELGRYIDLEEALELCEDCEEDLIYDVQGNLLEESEL